jgi:Right handed beta helix region
MRTRQLMASLALAAVTAAALHAAVAEATSATVAVSTGGEFAAAVARLTSSGGRIVLQPGVYGGALVVPARSGAPLRIEGTADTIVERLVLDHADHVSLGHLRISPIAGDAGVDVVASRHVELHDLFVTAQGTTRSASIRIPDSHDVTVRDSEFAHCGDHTAVFVNCLLVLDWASHVVIEDSWFHDCSGCDFVHGRFGSQLTIRRNRFERALPCRLGRVRCGHQDLIELFAGRRLRVEANRFGVYRVGGAQLYLTGPMSDVVVANNLFLGYDRRVPGYRARVGLIVGSSGSGPVPRYVRIVNNTILTGARRLDGYTGSLRMSSRYGGMPRRMRPILANNVIGVLETPNRVCSTARLAVSNVVMRGSPCTRSDVVGSPNLDRRGRPTLDSDLLIDRANRHYAPRSDYDGRRRGRAPDIGAYEYAR